MDLPFQLGHFTSSTSGSKSYQLMAVFCSMEFLQHCINRDALNIYWVDTEHASTKNKTEHEHIESATSFNSCTQIVRVDPHTLCIQRMYVHCMCRDYYRSCKWHCAKEALRDQSPDRSLLCIVVGLHARQKAAHFLLVSDNDDDGAFQPGAGR